MALTEAKIKDLESKLFNELYEEHEEPWRNLASSAQKYARDNVTGGKDPRPDDIAKALYPILEVDERLRAHQEDNAAKAKRWVEWFTEYVIDRFLKEKK